MMGALVKLAAQAVRATLGTFEPLNY